jgi:DNA mismatch endonuclease, patch repair protein
MRGVAVEAAVSREDPATRSRLMARIRGTDTDPERALNLLLRSSRIRYHPNDARLPGVPDFVLPDARLAIFVDGCFWHGCPKHYVAPATNVGYWRRKLRRNLARRVQVVRDLEAAGWRVAEVWECEIREDLGRVAVRIATQMRSG